MDSDVLAWHSLLMDEFSTIEDFRRRLEDDLARGIIRPLQAYLRAGSGLESAISQEYASRIESAPTEIGRSSSSDDDLVGQKLAQGRYRILRRIGSGGQATVFLADDLNLNRKVAIKIFSRRGLVSPRQRERFRREGLIASRLDHPAICAVHDSGEEQGMTYLVMRFIEGKSLATLISQKVEAGSNETRSLFYGFDESGTNSASEIETKPITPKERYGSTTRPQPVEEILEIIIKTARALDAVHRAGVVHRDLKPGNIMITAAHEPVVFDFGMARDEEMDAPTLTLSGEVFGTPSYMSPEQVSGKQDDIDKRSDVYSLGVTLYECLTLRRPFAAPTRERLFQQIASVEAEDPRRLNPLISRDLSVVIATAMSKERARRYQSAEDLALELERVRDRRPILARPLGPIPRFQRWFRRNPAIASTATAAFVLLLLASITMFALSREAQQERDRADARTQEYERLADAQRLKDLLKEAEDKLWPIGPEKAAAMENWLGRARALVARIPEHRSALKDLRQLGEMETLVRSDRPAGSRRERHAAGIAADSRGERPAFDLRLKTESREYEERWHFESPEDAWRHDLLVTLISDLEKLASNSRDDITIVAMDWRLRRAQELERLSILNHEDAWVAAQTRVARSPLYKGLELQPQIGLVPIGPNEAGFEEFEHLLTAADPAQVSDRQDGLILVLLPGADLQLGSPLGEPGRRADEELRRVSLAPFFISKYELNQRQWAVLMGSNPSHTGGNENAEERRERLLCPLDSVSALEADRFAMIAGLRLPTENEWEYACRGGTETAYWWGDDEGRAEDFANVGSGSFESDSLTGRTCSVYSGTGNPFGLFGFHGNIAEWCQDDYRADMTSLASPASGENAAPRSYRDGSFLLPVVFGRSAARHRADPGVRVRSFGLRPARKLDT